MGWEVYSDGLNDFLVRVHQDYAPAAIYVRENGFDLPPDDQDAEVRQLIDPGARRVSLGQELDSSWVVLADPDGNEFCALKPLLRQLRDLTSEVSP